MSVIPFPSFSYDSQLEGTRSLVLEALKNDPSECQKIRSCKGSSLRCHSIYCPSCLRGRAYRDKGRILAACDGIAPDRLRMSTFKSKDVPLDALRDTGRVLMEASRTALKRPTVDGYVQKLETSFEDFSNLYHPHVHAILDTPAGGRGFIPRAAYEHEWLRALPSHLHPLADAVYSEPARDVEACCTYIAKSPFHKKSSAEEVARTVEAIRAHKGLLKTAYRGSLDEQETAHCAAA